MSQIRHDTLSANGIDIHYAEAGEGHLVVLCHGFPELGYSWRHQLLALAEAGYRAVAPDMRGYGKTSAPDEIDQYTITHLVGDVVGLVNALGADHATIVGHDWGALVTWQAALWRPDLFTSVAVLSVPYIPPIPVTPDGTSGRLLIDSPKAGSGFYRTYFQEPGKAEADLEADVRTTMLGTLYSISGEMGVNIFTGLMDEDEGLRGALTVPDTLPDWLTEEDLATYVSEFERTGFRGGFELLPQHDPNPRAAGAVRRHHDHPAGPVPGG